MVIYSEMSIIMVIINWCIVGNDNGIHSYTVHNDIIMNPRYHDDI